MARISKPNIPDDIYSRITTVASAQIWIKKLEDYANKLQEELSDIRSTLKYCVRPKLCELIEERRQDGNPVAFCDLDNLSCSRDGGLRYCEENNKQGCPYFRGVRR